VLGPEEGFARAEREGLAGYFLVRVEGGSFESRSTRAFRALPGAPIPLPAEE
jgi:hypothetical protein